MKTREKVAIGDKKEVVEVGWSDIEGDVGHFKFIEFVWLFQYSTSTRNNPCAGTDMPAAQRSFFSMMSQN